MPPTTPHPNNKHKSSAMTNSQKGKSTAQTSTKSKTTLLNGETEPPTRKFGNQALSYEEREERDRTVAMLRSWEMCAVMGEEDAENGGPVYRKPGSACKNVSSASKKTLLSTKGRTTVREVTGNTPNRPNHAEDTKMGGNGLQRAWTEEQGKRFPLREVIIMEVTGITLENREIL
ncbi:MAG: hypothetical protein LQ343_003473 [Gyalolechia ehrenbergii]|nr:MAG: hypothetical protein LQ343_003473 [Gyalolechia ehrenbergii]